MSADQLLSVFLLASTLLLVGLWARLIAFARLNRRLREALRRRPQDVPELAAKLRHWPCAYDLLGWAIVAAAAALVLIGAHESAGAQQSVLRMAFVTALPGVTMLLYIQLGRRRHRQRRQA